jgi:hypothetical protein
MRSLPLDKRGYPVPFFVAWVNGEPDFRVMDERKWSRCVRERLCWICGGRLGAHGAFVIGPMCSINRTSAEPPAHLDCATFAAQACPFLTMPKMRRREDGLPEATVDPAGQMLRRNPGVALVWATRKWTLFRVGRDPLGGRAGWLFQLGDPTEVSWFAEGRRATRAEVLESIDSGCPLLRDVAEAEGPEAVADFESMKAAAMRFLPTEAAHG